MTLVAGQLVIIGAAATVLAIAGCGGGSGGGTTTKAPSSGAATVNNAGAAAGLSHSALTAQANAACATASAATAKVAPATTIGGLASYAGQVQAIGAALHAQLAKLQPTLADRATFQTFLDGLQTSNSALASMQTAAAKHNEDGVRTAASAIAGTDVGVLAARAGFGLCATATKTPGS